MGTEHVRTQCQDLQTIVSNLAEGEMGAIGLDLPRHYGSCLLSATRDEHEPVYFNASGYSAPHSPLT
jgi:hypothetical protein